MRSLIFFLLSLCSLSCKNEQPTQIGAFPILVDSIIVDTLVTPIPIDYDTSRWTELNRLMPELILDLKYATEDNFVKEKMYTCPRAFLQPKAAQALKKIQASLRADSLQLKILDAYRPRPIQQKLWNKVPDRRYVTPPSKGSMHNRGTAVDLTIVDWSGNELDMGTPYDYFGPEAWPEYRDLPEKVLENRKKLKSVMMSHGFKGIRTEWWHFSFPGTGAPLSDWVWECD